MIHNLSFISQGWKKVTKAALSAKVPSVGGPDFIKVADDGSGSTGVFGHAFDATSEESVFVSIVSPADYVPGGNIIPVVSWTSATSEANKKVSWGIEAWGAFGGEPFWANSVFEYGDVSSNGDDITAYDNNYTKMPELSGETAINTNNVMLFRIFRDATGVGGTDDFTGDVILTSFSFVYYADKIGIPENPIA